MKTERRALLITRYRWTGGRRANREQMKTKEIDQIRFNRSRGWQRRRRGRGSRMRNRRTDESSLEQSCCQSAMNAEEKSLRMISINPPDESKSNKQSMDYDEVNRRRISDRWTERSWESLNWRHLSRDPQADINNFLIGHLRKGFFSSCCCSFARPNSIGKLPRRTTGKQRNSYTPIRSCLDSEFQCFSRVKVYSTCSSNKYFY
jgi:hypothetical protein